MQLQREGVLEMALSQNSDAAKWHMWILITWSPTADLRAKEHSSSAVHTDSPPITHPKPQEAASVPVKGLPSCAGHNGEHILFSIY